MKIDAEEIKRAARQELHDEARRAAIDAEKERLRHRKPLWARVFPFRIIIVRR